MVQLFALLLDNRRDARRVRIFVGRWINLAAPQDARLNDIILEEEIPLAAARQRGIRAILLLLFLSGLFGITLIAMQIVGFAHAIEGLQAPPSNYTWYCPIFKIGPHIFDRGCNSYDIMPSPTGGADCIAFPDDQNSLAERDGCWFGCGNKIFDAFLIIRLGKQESRRSAPGLQ